MRDGEPWRQSRVAEVGGESVAQFRRGHGNQLAAGERQVVRYLRGGERGDRRCERVGARREFDLGQDQAGERAVEDVDTVEEIGGTVEVAVLGQFPAAEGAEDFVFGRGEDHVGDRGFKSRLGGVAELLAEFAGRRGAVGVVDTTQAQPGIRKVMVDNAAVRRAIREVRGEGAEEVAPFDFEAGVFADARGRHDGES